MMLQQLGLVCGSEQTWLVTLWSTDDLQMWYWKFCIHSYKQIL